MVDRLLRYQLCLGENIPFSGRTVLELGAGPLLGWAFVGLALGAKKYYVLEPAFNQKVVTELTRYSREHRRYVSRVLGPVDSVEELLADGRVEVISGLASATGLPDHAVDMIVSNSVLEHIHNLPRATEEFRRITSSSAVQFHFVDLKDHHNTHNTGDPFQFI